MALYGPLLDRYGRDKGQYKHKEYHVTPEGGLLTGPQLVLALAERGDYRRGGINDFSRERWRIEPWLEFHGLDEGELEQILPGLFYGSSKITLETLAGSTRGPEDPYVRSIQPDAFERLFGDNPSLTREQRAWRGSFVAAVAEARDAIADGRVPAGAREWTKWWVGESQYVEGRAPMRKMPDLPADALRCVCEHLVRPIERLYDPQIIGEARALLAEGEDINMDDADAVGGLWARLDDSDGYMVEKLGRMWNDINYWINDKHELLELSRHWHASLGPVLAIYKQRRREVQSVSRPAAALWRRLNERHRENGYRSDHSFSEYHGYDY